MEVTNNKHLIHILRNKQMILHYKHILCLFILMSICTSTDMLAQAQFLPKNSERTLYISGNGFVISHSLKKGEIAKVFESNSDFKVVTETFSGGFSAGIGTTIKHTPFDLELQYSHSIFVMPITGENEVGLNKNIIEKIFVFIFLQRT